MRSRSTLMHHPVAPYDGEKVSGVSDALKSFREIGFQGRSLGQCFNILMRMLTDKDRPVVLLALAGAMVPGGLRKVVSDMIRYRVVDVLVSTGANLYHDVYEALGNRHFLAESDVSDVELRKHRINRMYDVYADDLRFYDTDDYIKGLADKLQPRSYSTREFLGLLGKTLEDKSSIIGTAAEVGAPVYCPAISDSSIGLALAKHAYFRLKEGEKPIVIDVLKDNLEFVDIKVHAGKTAVIMIGGGVPKNYVQQVTPMAEVLSFEVEGHSYGVSVTTDHPEWGGLSGCTFEESQSWGKYLPGAFFATVNCDATIALPLLFQGVLEEKKLWYPRSAFDFGFLG
ncbi:MAG: deoxyhypusine synthase family protein [Thaumarchaeota archaeon]|nr:deoxyhypusine synthase family protein [Nitrososphaerota archaeon]